MVYITKELCWTHWNEIANCEPQKENKLLAKIKLERNAAGEIVKLRKPA